MQKKKLNWFVVIGGKNTHNSQKGNEKRNLEHITTKYLDMRTENVAKVRDIRNRGSQSERMKKRAHDDDDDGRGSNKKHTHIKQQQPPIRTPLCIYKKKIRCHTEKNRRTIHATMMSLTHAPAFGV